MDEGWCSATALLDGTVSLRDIAEWNEVLEFRDENERRARAAAAAARDNS